MDANQTMGGATMTESSPVQGQQNNGNDFGAQNPEQSAETLNTEPGLDQTQKQPVPYDRFQEVIQERNQIKNHIGLLQNEYETLKQSLAEVRQFEEVLNNNPQLFDAIKEAVAQHNANGGQKLDQVLNPLMKKVETLDSQFTKLNENQYRTQFAQMIAQDKEISSFSKEMEALVYNIMSNIPGVVNQYNPELLQRAYKEARTFVDNIRKNSNAAYSNPANKPPVVPPSGGSNGVAPGKNSLLGSREARVAALSRGLGTLFN